MVHPGAKSGGEPFKAGDFPFKVLLLFYALMAWYHREITMISGAAVIPGFFRDVDMYVCTPAMIINLQQDADTKSFFLKHSIQFFH